jgi:hypothetical protein
LTDSAAAPRRQQLLGADPATSSPSPGSAEACAQPARSTDRGLGKQDEPIKGGREAAEAPAGPSAARQQMELIKGGREGRLPGGSGG